MLYKGWRKIFEHFFLTSTTNCLSYSVFSFLDWPDPLMLYVHTSYSVVSNEMNKYVVALMFKLCSEKWPIEDNQLTCTG